tara:strand:- start:797 stop:1078 length:282 start_codon:yes stop_codon:yes gene_type:complete
MAAAAPAEPAVWVAVVKQVNASTPVPRIVPSKNVVTMAVVASVVVVTQGRPVTLGNVWTAVFRIAANRNVARTAVVALVVIVAQAMSVSRGNV